MDPLASEREHGRHVRHVAAERLAGEPALAQLAVDELGERVRNARRVGHRAAHRRHPRAPARLGQPWAVELVVLGRRAEVPEDRVVLTEEEREADVLVALPRPDRRARDVAQVVRVEQQERAEVRIGQRRLRPRQPVARSRSKSTRCSQSTAILAPRDAIAMFVLTLRSVFSHSAQPRPRSQHCRGRSGACGMTVRARRIRSAGVEVATEDGTRVACGSTGRPSRRVPGTVREGRAPPHGARWGPAALACRRLPGGP